MQKKKIGGDRKGEREKMRESEEEERVDWKNMEKSGTTRREITFIVAVIVAFVFAAIDPLVVGLPSSAV